MTIQKGPSPIRKALWHTLELEPLEIRKKLEKKLNKTLKLVAVRHAFRRLSVSWQSSSHDVPLCGP